MGEMLWGCCKEYHKGACQSSPVPPSLRDGLLFPYLHPEPLEGARDPKHKAQAEILGTHRDPEPSIPESRQKHIFFLSCWDWDNWGIKENAFLTYFLSD